MVQKKSRSGRAGLIGPAIQAVPPEGMAQGRRVCPDLMTRAATDAAGGQSQAAGVIPPPSEDALPPCAGSRIRPASRPVAAAPSQVCRGRNSVQRSVSSVSASTRLWRAVRRIQGQPDCGRPGQRPPEQGQIALFTPARPLRHTEGLCRLCPQGRADNARSSVIQTLHEPWRAPFALFRQQGGQESLQAGAVVPGQGRAVQPGGLVQKTIVSLAGEQARHVRRNTASFLLRPPGRAEQERRPCRQTAGRVPHPCR